MLLLAALKKYGLIEDRGCLYLREATENHGFGMENIGG